VIPRFAMAVLEGRAATINGSGEISRDFTYVDNVIEANLLAARASSPSSITCNIACGTRYTLLELLSAIGDAAGRRVEPTFGPRRPGDIVHSQADITLAREALGYEPMVSFHEGIARTLAWYREEMTGWAAYLDLSPHPGA
jgi:nucleoside-diphosphate-sugar epimerase